LIEELKLPVRVADLEITASFTFRDALQLRPASHAADRSPECSIDTV
jgi:hypothetical protein